jgi:hypothetical protein
MIDFEDSKLGKRIAVRERVEPRAENDILSDTGRNRRDHAILGDAAAHGQERAKTRHEDASAAPSWIGVEDGLRLRAQHRPGQGIAEDRRPIQQLMRGAPERDGGGGVAGTILAQSFHR